MEEGVGERGVGQEKGGGGGGGGGEDAFLHETSPIPTSRMEAVTVTVTVTFTFTVKAFRVEGRQGLRLFFEEFVLRLFNFWVFWVFWDELCCVVVSRGAAIVVVVAHSGL